MKEKRWTVYGSLIVLAIIGSGLLAGKLSPWLKGWEGYGYFGVFLVSFVVNTTIILPAPFMGVTLSLAIGLASRTDLFSVALVYALGATFGEGIGYLLGFAGKKVMGIEGTPAYRKAENWLKKYGKWAIIGLSFQPLFPFDIVGIVAGTLKYPFWKFLIFCFLGRIPKYLIMILAGFETWKIFFQ